MRENIATSEDKRARSWDGVVLLTKKKTPVR